VPPLANPFNTATVADVPGESAVTLPHELAVPPGKGKPNLDFDIGVAAGLGNRLHTAKGRQFFVDGIRFLFVKVECAGFDHRGLNDLGLQDAQFGQVGAGLIGRRGRFSHSYTDCTK
jgi:hypothetical protein